MLSTAGRKADTACWSQSDLRLTAERTLLQDLKFYL